MNWRYDLPKCAPSKEGDDMNTDAREALRELLDATKHQPVDMFLRQRCEAALRQPAAPGGEICSVCCGSGYSNHPDSGEVCSACKGQGEHPAPPDE